MDDPTTRTLRLDVARASRGVQLADLARRAGADPSALSRLRAGRSGGRLTWQVLARALDLPDDALDPSPDWSAVLPAAEPDGAHAARALRFAVACAARGLTDRGEVERRLGLRRGSSVALLVRHGVECGRATWRNVELVLGLAAGALEPGASFVELIPAELRTTGGGADAT